MSFILFAEGFTSHPLNSEGFGGEVIGSEVIGAEVIGAEVIGSEVIGSEVIGAEVLTSDHLRTLRSTKFTSLILFMRLIIVKLRLNYIHGPGYSHT